MIPDVFHAIAVIKQSPPENVRHRTQQGMIEIHSNEIDWIAFRQALSLSLLTGRPFIYRGALAFINANAPYSAFLSDFELLFQNYNLGEFHIKNDDISFIPKPVRFGTFDISVNPYSSAIEILLLLLPVLFHQEFRSRILISGVTHSPLSFGTGWMKESFLALFESMGLYASCSLRRFGFYGSGGGGLESRVYPAEKKKAAIPLQGDISAYGARVFIAHLDSSIARSQKEIIEGELGIDSQKTGILEVRDCDGAWNHAEVYLMMGNLPLVISETTPVYGFEGENLFSPERALETPLRLAKRVREIITEGRMPDDLLREAISCMILTGNDVGLETFPVCISEAEKTARLFLDDRTIVG